MPSIIKKMKLNNLKNQVILIFLIINILNFSSVMSKSNCKPV